jgi:hypothetical protein
MGTDVPDRPAFVNHYLSALLVPLAFVMLVGGCCAGP